MVQGTSVSNMEFICYCIICEKSAELTAFSQERDYQALTFTTVVNQTFAESLQSFHNQAIQRQNRKPECATFMTNFMRNQDIYRRDETVTNPTLKDFNCLCPIAVLWFIKL